MSEVPFGKILQDKMSFFTLRKESELVENDYSNHIAQLCEKLSCFELKIPLPVQIKLCSAISNTCLVLHNVPQGLAEEK